jgi:DNA-binding transcriptional ArsR family regulator
MSAAANAHARRLDATLLAIADPTRRAILERLHAGEARVTDVAEPFRMSLNAVSKHIRVLESAGLVLRRKAGREHFISANLAPLELAAAWIEHQRAFWTARLDALDDLLCAEDAARARRKPKKGSVQ